MVRADKVDAFVKTRDAYARLHEWIGERVNSDGEEVKKLSVSIRPKGSYFARHGIAQLTYGLPKDLQKEMDETETPPVSVTLSIKGSWIICWADGKHVTIMPLDPTLIHSGSRSWDLRNAYPSLVESGHLDKTTNPVIFAALNPYAEDHYFLVSKDGLCSYSLTSSDNEEGSALHEMTEAYMGARARRDGSSFAYSMTLNDVPKSIRITPSSSAQESRTEAVIATLRARQGLVKSSDTVFVGAVADGTGLLAKVARLPTVKAVGMGAMTGFGAAHSMWYFG